MTDPRVSRRDFGKLTATGSMVAAMATQEKVSHAQDEAKEKPIIVDDFDRSDSFYHGDGWESLNPGYWKIENKSLRRRVRTRGDRARRTGFPYHYKTHNITGGVMNTDYKSSPPYGMIWRREWKLSGHYRIEVRFTVRALPAATTGFEVKPGDGIMGICFGGQTRMESWYGGAPRGQACWYAGWRDNGQFGIYDHGFDKPTPAKPSRPTEGPQLKAGDEVTMVLEIKPKDALKCDVIATLKVGERTYEASVKDATQARDTDGFFGIVARGLLDFEVNEVRFNPFDNAPIPAPVNELRLAYPIGNTLRKVDGVWRCRFMCIFRDNGDKAELRIGVEENPGQGWKSVKVAGEAEIKTNDFRRATAVIDAELPANLGETTMYYTVWKDGTDVTLDPRIGYLGKKDYVGRLPQLVAPYRMCGLSCHAIHGQFDGGLNKKFEENWIHDQPAVNAYKHLDDYNFQIMVWEDDIWYLELLLYTTSVDDAYLQIMTALGGPTSRWQMMRHWNTLNPGDHDYGMDDIKGPEQLAIRQREDLGQDREYLRRNFEIVQHIISGDENPPGTENPKRWSAWKMPNNDFTLAIVDARLWRDTQETHVWADSGWGKKGNVYNREMPMRTLLGEEQFAWLKTLVTTDTSPLILVTGLNGMHTIWEPSVAEQRNRVVADYAGWVKAGCDRVIELLSSRNGIVSVYGDVHNGCIMRNIEHNLFECSFGPIGRTGGRAVKPQFGPKMKDFDGRELEVYALYHKQYQSPKLEPRTGPQYWNFLEVEMDPRGKGSVAMKVRNLIDAPDETPRGGGEAKASAAETGRPITSRFPTDLETHPNADVRFSRLNGTPIRGTRSLPNGTLSIEGLVDVRPGETILMTSITEDKVDARRIQMKQAK